MLVFDVRLLTSASSIQCYKFELVTQITHINLLDILTQMLFKPLYRCLILNAIKANDELNQLKLNNYILVKP